VTLTPPVSSAPALTGGTEAAPRVPSQRTAATEPVAPRPGVPAPLTPTERVLTQIAAARVVLATGAAAAASMWPHSNRNIRELAFIIALGWLPIALAVFIGSDEPKRPISRYGGWLGDLVALGLAITLVPDTAQPVRFLLVVVAVIALYTCPELPLLVAPGVCLAVGIGGTTAAGWTTSSAVGIAIFTIVTVIVTTTWRFLVRHGRATAQMTSWLRDRADAVVDHIPTPVLLTDDAGVIQRWNPATSATLGLNLEAGQHCGLLDLHYGERRLDCSQGCALRALCGDGPDASVEVWRPVGDSRQPLLASVTAVPDVESGPYEVLHAFRDITRLKEADEAKTLFLATASHELKTPLTVIRGFAEMLNSGRLADEAAQARAFEAIYARSLELGRVVDRLLMSSRIDAGRLSVKVEPLDIAAIVAERVSSFGESGDRRIEFTIEGTPVPALAEPTALMTVVDHLIENALKYSPPESPVTVRLHHGETAVRIVVHDSGIGMTREEARQCFDKFWQADSGDRRKFGGTGIGLYIARSLVESMGGRIDVASQPGAGATFTVGLLTVVEDVPAPRPPVEPERSIIREFMRQIGVPADAGGAPPEAST
jgi:PAS domain S-box-containing protein